MTGGEKKLISIIDIDNTHTLTQYAFIRQKSTKERLTNNLINKQLYYALRKRRNFTVVKRKFRIKDKQMHLYTLLIAFKGFSSVCVLFLYHFTCDFRRFMSLIL
jgi:hypothetical protein